MSARADYASIDPVLDQWARRHGVTWVKDDRGWDVRTISWLLAPPESVQLWIDEPTNDCATVHVCHNTTRGGQQHTQLHASPSDLEGVLDESLDRALRLASELKRNAVAPD